MAYEVDCPHCDGRAEHQLSGDPCWYCRGKGYIERLDAEEIEEEEFLDEQWEKELKDRTEQAIHDMAVAGCEACPVCNNQTLMTGEYVDVGVGCVQCSPDFCEFCGYCQSGLYTENQYTYDQFLKLWEIQIDPWSRKESPNDT